METYITAYYYVAVLATVLFVLKLVIFAVVGGDVEVHTDFNASFETDTSFDFLSIQSILAFFMGFGWVGHACLYEMGLRLRYAVLFSVLVGLLLMYLSAWLMFCVKKLNHRVKKDFSKSVGLEGRAYTNFAPHSNGQIEIIFNGQLSVEEAINDTDNEIKSFSNIKIVKYENGILYIEQK